MPYVIIDNFSAGLDSRRHVLNSKDGTLAVLKNAHITRGGEIEKRKAFAAWATLPAGTFGVETTADAVYVFGSATGLTMPSGVTYQRLVHPTGAAMTSVVWSTVYGGKPFVIAEYADGKRYSFWDGTIVKDWFVGAATAAMGSLANLAENLRADFSYEGYTCTRSGNALSITGPNGKSFSVSATATSPMTATVATVQQKTDGVPEKLATGSFIISNGMGESAAKSSITMRYINASAMPDIKGIYVNGVEVTGISSSGRIRWDDFFNGEGDQGQRLGYTLATYININSSTSRVYATYQSLGGGWSGPDPGTLIINADPDEGPDANGWTVQIEFASTPASVGSIAELVTGITTSPYNAGRYIGTFAGGALAGGAKSTVQSVKVDGVEILGRPISWRTSNSATALLVAAQINAYSSSPEYACQVVDSATIKLTALAGTGASVNGKTISVITTGNVVVSGINSFTGGVNAVLALPQITTVTLGGTFTVGGKATVTVTDPEATTPYIFGATRVAGLQPAFSVTYKAKEYAAVGSTMYFSALNDASLWDIYDVGSGFIDMSNNFGGRSDLTGFGVYQDKLAVFSRRNVQLWFLDADPAQNQQQQVIANTGSIAPDSIVSMGSIDLIYLADNGIRSLRARDYTDSAFSNDIGSPIDSIVVAHLKTLTEAQRYAAKAVVEPTDGRYWLCVGGKVFVLSYFPGSNISAWSTYETGFTVDDIAAKDDKIYLRAGNVIYVYGGTDGATYDASEVVIEFPYMDARKPGTYKRAKAIDLTLEGLWKVEMGFDHTNPGAREVIARPSQSTFALGTIPIAGIGTHFGLKMSSTFAGPAKLSNVIFHYDELQPKHEAG